MDWSLFANAAFLVALISTGIRLATPVLLSLLGEIVCERSGVMNVGLEGIMAVGGLVGFAVAFTTGSVWLGFLAALPAGAVMGYLLALLAVRLKIDQVVSGLVLVLLGVGLGNFLYRQLFGLTTSPPRVPAMQGIHIPILTDIPYIGKILFGQSPAVYVALALVALLWFAIQRTSWGLILRAAGEVPSAVDTAGISVITVRYAACMIGSALAALGGACLTSAQLGMYQEGVIAGRGWVALALVIFARWNPWLAVVGAFLFGLADSLQLRLQALMPSSAIPYEVFLMLPYLLTIFVMLFARGRSAKPMALGEAYETGER